jgi:hypothetical protein
VSAGVRSEFSKVSALVYLYIKPSFGSFLRICAWPCGLVAVAWCDAFWQALLRTASLVST